MDQTGIPPRPRPHHDRAPHQDNDDGFDPVPGGRVQIWDVTKNYGHPLVPAYYNARQPRNQHLRHYDQYRNPVVAFQAHQIFAQHMDNRCITYEEQRSFQRGNGVMNAMNSFTEGLVPFLAAGIATGRWDFPIDYNFPTLDLMADDQVGAWNDATRFVNYVLTYYKHIYDGDNMDIGKQFTFEKIYQKNIATWRNNLANKMKHGMWTMDGVRNWAAMKHGPRAKLLNVWANGIWLNHAAIMHQLSSDFNASKYNAKRISRYLTKQQVERIYAAPILYDVLYNNQGTAARHCWSKNLETN